MKRNEMIEILDFYFDSNKDIHIRCDDRRFYNGKIKEIDFDKERIIFDDKVLGEIILLIKNIIGVEPMIELKKEGEE